MKVVFRLHPVLRAHIRRVCGGRTAKRRLFEALVVETAGLIRLYGSEITYAPIRHPKLFLNGTAVGCAMSVRSTEEDRILVDLDPPGTATLDRIVLRPSGVRPGGRSRILSHHH
jgi:hypothetical protein